MGSYFVFPLISAGSVFFFWLVEFYLPYPWLVEEAAKFILVLAIRRRAPSGERLVVVLLSGAAFAVSEAFFYLPNYIQAGSLIMFGWRLVLTMPMHLATLLLLYWGSKGSAYRRAAALSAAGLIHFGFNRFSGDIFG